MVQVPESSQSGYSILRINMQSGNNVFYNLDNMAKEITDQFSDALAR